MFHSLKKLINWGAVEMVYWLRVLPDLPGPTPTLGHSSLPVTLAPGDLKFPFRD